MCFLQIGSPDFHKKKINAPEDFKKTAFQSYIFPVLSSLVTHHKYIDQSNQVCSYLITTN